MFDINQLTATVIEQALNRILSLDAEAFTNLKKFEDKVIHIQLSDLKLDYYFLFPGGSLVVLQNCDKPVSASIVGKSSAFLAAASSKNSGDALFTGELNFSGELNTARHFEEFVKSLQIDWQEPLSQVFGDFVTHNITQAMTRLTQFTSQILDNVRQDIPEYLQHEIQATPSNSELKHFSLEVDLTRSQADRLLARVKRLTSISPNAYGNIL